MATSMYRAGVCLPRETEEQLYNLRKLEKFKRCSISEIIRILVEDSLSKYDTSDTTEST